jgi:hypothetical protein
LTTDDITKENDFPLEQVKWWPHFASYALITRSRLGWDSCRFSFFCWCQVVRDTDGQFNDKLTLPVLWFYNSSVMLFPSPFHTASKSP